MALSRGTQSPIRARPGWGRRPLTRAGMFALCLAGGLAAAVPADAWTSRAERPPSRGEYFYVGPFPPAVNYLVPRGQRARYFKPTPWTKEWFAYCAHRWPSFNPRTGTIRTPDGVRMCL